MEKDFYSILKHSDEKGLLIRFETFCCKRIVIPCWNNLMEKDCDSILKYSLNNADEVAEGYSSTFKYLHRDIEML